MKVNIDDTATMRQSSVILSPFLGHFLGGKDDSKSAWQFLTLIGKGGMLCHYYHSAAMPQKT
jgi:hypothetical protein